MKKTILFVIISFLVGAEFISAQTVFKPNLFSNQKVSKSINTTDTLKILALMVEFQEDRYDATEGDGTFGSHYSNSTASRNDILDPLPHNKQYFENHLLFAKNYFEKASDNKLFVEYEVFPTLIKLDSTMRYYSPEVGSSDVSRIVRMCRQSWQKASSAEINFPFENFNMFVIFHAGVGRDVSLPGSLGIERDIPSVNLRFENGVPVGLNNFEITNTAVLPETETRELATIMGSAIVELTINGLLAGMIGSYLGLPDLFNTETGYSAIGRLGLMDGQSMFSYLGAFPPMPSPIEKYWLGWLDLEELQNKNKTIGLATYETASIFFNDTSVVKIPINRNEYFIVENRQRDARNDGATVTYISGGIIKQKTFTADSLDYFNNWQLNALEGVITDVDEFDWALPASGILIWHIDENIIDQKQETNTINNDFDNKGVKVVEADGINDIGIKFTSIFGDVYVGEGEESDFWFSENSANYYENEFTPNSKPNTNSNSGANSGIYLSNFSSNANKIFFDYSYQNDQIELIATLPNENSIKVVSAQNSGLIGNLKNGNLFVYDLQGNLVKEIAEFSNQEIVQFYNSILKRNLFVGIKDEYVKFYDYNLENSIETIDSFAIQNINYSFITAFSESDFILFSPLRDSLVVKKLDFTDVNSIVTESLQTNCVVNNFLIRTNENIYDCNIEESSTVTQLSYSSTNSNISTMKNLVLLRDDNLEIIDYSTSEITGAITIPLINTIDNFSLLTSENKSQNYISFGIDSILYAYNMEGKLVDGFPKKIPNRVRVNENPSSIVSYADGNEVIGIYVSQNGDIYKTNSNYPIASVGEELIENPILTTFEQNLYLVINGAENIFIYKLSTQNSPSVYWSGNFGDAVNSNQLNMHDTQIPTSNFEQIKAYNWPNPIYDGEVTHFRFGFIEDADVTIKIFDLGGSLVAELNGSARTNLENEIDWNTQNVQSDVYFALLTAKSSSGKEYQKIIKVAVIK